MSPQLKLFNILLIYILNGNSVIPYQKSIEETEEPEVSSPV